MAKRVENMAEVRQRIIDAAVGLHAEKGLVATKPREIAARANVALTTYYKHFPTLPLLVRACTERGGQLVPPPKSESLAALSPDPVARIGSMVRGLFEYYEAREPWLYVGRAERHLVPELTPVLERQRAARDALIRTALHGVTTERHVEAVVAALVDFWAWRTLRREAGVPQEDAIQAVTEALKRILREIKEGNDGVRDRNRP